MSRREAVFARTLRPLADPSFRAMRRHLPRLRRQARATLEENQAQQWQALTRLLRHAWETCPFYRQRFEAADLHFGDIRAPADLERLPPLTRQDLRQHLGDICSTHYAPSDLLAAATGGTTDTPVALRRDRACISIKGAIQQTYWEWAGVGAGAKVFWLWGAVSDFSQNPSWRWRLYDRYLMRQVWAPSSWLNPTVMEQYRQTMNRFRPAAVCAYPTPLYLFCAFLRATGRPYHRPRAVICTAEALLPDQRALIAEVLQCPIFEHYGARDFGMIAAECEAHRGLHLHPAAAYVESRPAGAGPEAPHELFITDLNNYGMPLIRYQVNDCVQAALTPAVCACGRGFPLLPPITGRTADTFRLPNGNMVPGIALTNRVIKVAPSLAKTQVIQETVREFRLRYVPGPGFVASDLDPLRRKLDEFLGDGLQWEFEAVAEIGREASGKTRFCISRLSAPEPGH